MRMAGLYEGGDTFPHPLEGLPSANIQEEGVEAAVLRRGRYEDNTSQDDQDFRGQNPNSFQMISTGNRESLKIIKGSTNSGGIPEGLRRSKSDAEKKVGHRRVTQSGDVTYKKIQTSQIMRSIQLGVQHAIGGQSSKPDRDLLIPDFYVVQKTNFPSKGSSETPAHSFSDFRFKAYAPMAFRHFRSRFGIEADDFLLSLCEAPLIELTNSGASGSIFYLTSDDNFIIKTVQHKECDFLRKILAGYFNNLLQNPHTLLPKLFGLFTYQCNSKNVKLCVMNNILPSWIKIHQKYDLKGSTHKRKASSDEREKAHPTFKDLDFLEHHPNGIFLEDETHASLLKALHRDSLVLESFDIMDYSLLLCIHNVDLAAKEKTEWKSSKVRREDEGACSSAELNQGKSINRQELMPHSTALESIQAGFGGFTDSDNDRPLEGIPAWNSKGERLVLYLGIIDILQTYRLTKKLEHTFKAMFHDADTISVQKSRFYASRFMNFMTKSVFRKISSR